MPDYLVRIAAATTIFVRDATSKGAAINAAKEESGFSAEDIDSITVSEADEL